MYAGLRSTVFPSLLSSKYCGREKLRQLCARQRQEGSTHLLRDGLIEHVWHFHIGQEVLECKRGKSSKGAASAGAQVCKSSRAVWRRQVSARRRVDAKHHGSHSLGWRTLLT